MSVSHLDLWASALSVSLLWPSQECPGHWLTWALSEPLSTCRCLGKCLNSISAQYIQVIGFSGNTAFNNGYIISHCVSLILLIIYLVPCISHVWNNSIVFRHVETEAHSDSISGTSDVWRFGHLLLPGGMGMAEPHPEGFVQRCHVGQLPEPGLSQ